MQPRVRQRHSAVVRASSVNDRVIGAATGQVELEAGAGDVVRRTVRGVTVAQGESHGRAGRVVETVLHVDQDLSTNLHWAGEKYPIRCRDVQSAATTVGVDPPRNGSDIDAGRRMGLALGRRSNEEPVATG